MGSQHSTRPNIKYRTNSFTSVADPLIPRVPEKQLISAVIVRAVLDLTSADHKIESGEWIDSESTQEWSFLWCCQTLDIEADWMRKNISDLLRDRPHYLRFLLFNRIK